MTYTQVRYAGFGREAAFGTEAEPTFDVDQASASLEPPSGTEKPVPSSSGRMYRKRRPGYYSPAGAIDYAFDIDTIGYPLKWALHGYDFTTGTPNSHEIYGDQELQLESFTARLGKDFFEHIFLGCVVNTITLSVGEDYAMASIGIVAQKDGSDNLRAYNNLLLPDLYPLMFHEVTAKIGATDISTVTTAASIEIANNINVGAGRTIGSRFPRRLYGGRRAITGSATLYFESTTQLEKFWGSSSGPAAGGATETSFTLKFAYDANNYLEILLPNAYIDAIPTPPRAAGEQLTQEITFATLMKEDVELIDESTVDTDIYVLLKNTEPTMA